MHFDRYTLMIENTTEYYYTEDGNQVVGPHSFSQIMQLRNLGKISDDTQVCKAGETKWTPFGDVLADVNKKQAKDVNKPATPETKKIVQRPDKLVTQTIKLSKKVESKTSFNTALLVVIAILLICQLISGNSSMPSLEKYEYGAVLIDRDDMFDASRSHKEKNPDVKGPIELPNHCLHMGEGDGWEYVGILCNNGINGSWLLVRREKKN